MLISSDAVWTAPIDLGKGIDIYNEILIRKYFTSLYHAVLFFTGNDILPRGDTQVIFIILSHIMGAIINANILGSMAVLIQDLNKKTDSFQKKLDQVNTAM